MSLHVRLKCWRTHKFWPGQEVRVPSQVIGVVAGHSGGNWSGGNIVAEQTVLGLRQVRLVPPASKPAMPPLTQDWCTREAATVRTTCGSRRVGFFLELRCYLVAQKPFGTSDLRWKRNSLIQPTPPRLA